MKRKLPKKERDLLWGGEGPYSDAKIVLNMRILDDSVSRMMVEVEGHINPTTFRMVKANKKYFANDEDVLSLLATAEYQNERDGYLVAIGEPEEFVDVVRDKSGQAKSEAFLKAAKKQEYLKATILKMHRFVMDQLGIPLSDDPEKENIFKKDKTVAIPSRYFY